MNRPNTYKNWYPYNLCYYDGNVISADCWNIIKSLIWDNNIDQNYTVGKSAVPNFSTGLYDWNGEQMWERCTERSNVFENAPVGAFLIYSDGSHAGIYAGNGKAIEMTALTNCVCLTDIGSHGQRIYNGKQYGNWRGWGIMPWITYIDIPSHDLKVGDIVRLKQGVRRDIHGTWLNTPYLEKQTLYIYSISGNTALVYNKLGWAEVEMYLSDLEKVKEEHTEEAIETPEETKEEAPEEVIENEIVEELIKEEDIKVGDKVRCKFFKALDLVFNDYDVVDVKEDNVYLSDGRVLKKSDLKII